MDNRVSKAPSPMMWVAMQAALHGARDPYASPRRVVPPNPKPPGQFLAGGAPEAVLGWLLQRRGGWWSMMHIISGTGRSAKACSWAVIYLARLGYIERERDHCNSRYLRYRASEAARETILRLHSGGMQ